MTEGNQPPEKSKIVPNTFQTPNILVDDLMRYLDGDEVKCYLVVTRKTFGWLKRSDRIAKSQIVELTGLSDGRVDDCMKTLVSFGLVLRIAENDARQNFGAEWALQIDDKMINISAMFERDYQRVEVNKKRAQKWRERKREVGMCDIPGYVAQPQSGYVAQPPQKPLSKAKESYIGDAVILHMQSIGMHPNSNTPTILTDWRKNHTDEWIIRALDMSRGKNQNYADKILLGWETEGYPKTREQQRQERKSYHAKPATTQQPAPAPERTPEQIARERAEYRAWKAEQQARANM